MKKRIVTGACALTAGLVAAAAGFYVAAPNAQGQMPFQIEEATIAGVHQAIRQGQITCVGLVQAYFNRAKAYNGVASALVTPDGAPIPSATGTVRAGAPLDVPDDDGQSIDAPA